MFNPIELAAEKWDQMQKRLHRLSLENSKKKAFEELAKEQSAIHEIADTDGYKVIKNVLHNIKNLNNELLQIQKLDNDLVLKTQIEYSLICRIIDELEVYEGEIVEVPEL